MATSNLESLLTKPGVCLLQFSGTNKKYVGSSVNVRCRVQKHIWTLQRGRHYNLHLQNVYCKYKTLEVSVLEYVDSPADLILAEQYWIDTLDTHKNGLNLLPKAYSPLGVRRSDATKAKISLIRKGKRHSDASKALMSRAKKGVTNEANSIANMTLSTADMRLAFSMALEENTQNSIAKVLGVSRQTVSSILLLKMKAYVRAANTDAELQSLVEAYNQKRSSSK